MEPVRHIIGCMTGTSIDGLDAAVVRIEGRGLAMRAKCLCHVPMSLGVCQQPLRDLAGQRPFAACDIASLADAFADVHIQACRRVWQEAGEAHAIPARPDLISVHGQTVWHRPPVSWQLFQPAPLALAMQTTVVCDLRQADLAAGGQGAPLTPAADYVLFAREDEVVSVVNFGGFCNATHLARRPVPGNSAAPESDPALLEADAVAGGDVCPCNHLLDEIARRGLGRAFDADGEAASRGTPREQLLKELQELLAGGRGSGRSLGTGDECVGWVVHALGRCSVEDVAASAAKGIAARVAMEIEPGARVLCFGGGARHQRLMAELGGCLGPGRIEQPPMAPEAREAVCWAVLGALAQDCVEIGVPQITGRAKTPRIAGLWAR